jgi:hypothetical protein
VTKGGDEDEHGTVALLPDSVYFSTIEMENGLGNLGDR